VLLLRLLLRLLLLLAALAPSCRRHDDRTAAQLGRPLHGARAASALRAGAVGPRAPCREEVAAAIAGESLKGVEERAGGGAGEDFRRRSQCGRPALAHSGGATRSRGSWRRGWLAGLPVGL
jgi:hypothetical protein